MGSLDRVGALASASASVRRRVLFGGPHQPWHAEDWRAVDDRIRGGSSTSHLVVGQSRESHGQPAAHFYGHLDTKTLGGAGFASQACTTSYNLEDYDGLEILLLPSGSSSSSDAVPRHFTLNLKTELPDKRPDGRNQSVTVYEYDFSGLLSTSASAFDAKHSLARQARWADFKPTYRGRPVPPHEATPLDPSEIKEVSIMCRSNFDAQQGDFSLWIQEIAAVTGLGKRTGRLQEWWSWLASWFWSILILRGRRKGGVRL